MTDLQYQDQAELALKAIEATCDRINDETDADIDNQRSGAMIMLTFPDRSQIVINLQKPLQEIWMAARSGGFHYKYTVNGWYDTKSGHPLFESLSRCASEQAGRTLVFLPPA
jgi:CyaY protein